MEIKNLVLCCQILGLITFGFTGEVHACSCKKGLLVTRSYPICFFNMRPSPSELTTVRGELEKFVAPYMPGSIYQIGFSPDTRWVSLKGSQNGHTALKKVWPRIGCVGGYVSSQEYVAYKRCVDYLAAFLSQSKYTFGGKDSDGDGISGQLFCDGK